MATVTREQKAIAAWTQAMATAENYAIDPHRHIALLVQAGEQMAALLTPGSAATSPPATVTREQLQSIEWNGWNRDEADTCPACGRDKRRGHNDVCFIAAALASAPPAAPPEDAHDKPAKADVWHLHAYVVDHAADHDDDCPGDDTCTCSFKARNDAVSRCVRWLIEHPRAASPAPPDPPWLADDRCAVCGWPLDPKEQMCRRGNCSMRPMPERAADPARAIAEYSAVWGGMARQTLQRWQEQLAEQIARQSDPPGLASLARSLAEALWDMQSAPDCWCPSDRSCTDGHTEACTAARAVNGAAKRFHLYNESPLPARQSVPPGLVGLVREWQEADASLGRKWTERVPLDVEQREIAARDRLRKAALPATDPQEARRSHDPR